MPEKSCVVPGCSERGIHKFPRDHNCWLKWRKAIIRATYPKVSNSWHPRYTDTICSHHFKPDEFLSFSHRRSNRVLITGSVPSIFNQKDNSEELEVQTSDKKVEEPIADSANFNQKDNFEEIEVQVLDKKVKVLVADSASSILNKKDNKEELEIQIPEKQVKVKIMSAANLSSTSESKKEDIVHHVAKGSSRRVTIFQGENHAPNMCKALNDLRVRGACCDVSIIVPNSAMKDSEGIKFKAHSVVLAARSSFFKTFFMKPENYTHQTIIMPHYINGRAVEIVLHYMYTGKLGIRKDTVSTIFQVGWLFQMDDILMLCKQFCKMKKFTPSPVEVNAGNYSKDETASKPENKNNTNDNTNDDDDDNVDNEENQEQEMEILTSNDIKEESDEISTEMSKIDEAEAEITSEIKKITNQASVVNEISVVMKDEKYNELQLVEGPPEMIECTPTILAENEDDEEYTTPQSQLLQDKRERKLIIFKTGSAQSTQDGCSRLPNENGFGNADLIVVHFRPNLIYPSPVLYVLHGMKNYSDLLIKHGFFHIEFHVDNNCRKGVVKTDGSLICVMFGQVNHFFPIFHLVTPEDIETYRYEENKPLTFSTKRIVPIKRPLEMTDEWDPIFGRDKNCEKDVLHCFSCSCVFFTIQGKASHLLRHHRGILHWDTELNVYKYPCGACEFMCTNLRLLYFHRHQKHDWLLPEVVLQFRCGLCCACETSIHTARDHMVKVHNYTQFSNPLANAAAGKKVFLHLVTKDGLKRQLIAPDPEIVDASNETHPVDEKKVKEKPFKCPHCEYESAYNGNLKCHMKNKHTAGGGDKIQKKKRRRRRKNVY